MTTAPYPDAWTHWGDPARMMVSARKIAALHERWQDRGPQVRGVVEAARKVIAASTATAHEKMAWNAELAEIEDAARP